MRSKILYKNINRVEAIKLGFLANVEFCDDPVMSPNHIDDIRIHGTTTAERTTRLPNGNYQIEIVNYAQT